MNYDVTEACASLETAVRLFCRRTRKRFPGTEIEREKILKRVDILVGHAHFIIERLTVKRLSLHEALESLRECWPHYVAALTQSKLQNLKSVLAVLLQHYLRIRDGLILLESGECRHEGDYPKPNNPFKTRLTKNKTCDDGYTKLYSKDLKYAGFGWDEFYDEKYGVKTLLLKALKSLSSKSRLDSIWEKLLESGAQVFESCLDNHETKIQVLRKAAETLRETIKQSLLQLLQKFAGGRGQVNFVTQDKMEYLEVRLQKEVAGISSVKLQRRANEFQVQGSRGVLPDGWDRNMWKNHMNLPSRYVKSVVGPIESNGTKKRRRVIDDSSDDEAPDANLHVHEKKVQCENAEHTVSLKAIKVSMGVDVSGLETARESLEAENNSNAKVLSEATTEDEHLVFSIKNGRAKVARLRNILEHAEEVAKDPIEIWDVRDSLREEAMQLGNDLLLLHSCDRSIQHLKDARSCFKEALQLVEQQEAAHSFVSKQYKDEDGFLCRQRNLQLLKGRAQTNCGIAALELSLAPKSPSIMRKKWRGDASKELKSAIQSAKALYTKSMLHRDQGGSASETIQNIIDAAQLESLASRSLGAVLWHDNKQSKAVECFNDASHAYHKIEFLSKDGGSQRNGVLELYLDTLSECYSSCCKLYDLSASKIDELSMAVSKPDSKNNLQELLQIAEKAISNAKVIVTCVVSFNRSPSDTGMEDISFLESTIDDLSKMVNEISQTPMQRALCGPNVIIARDIPEREVHLAESGSRKISKGKYLFSNSLPKKHSKFRSSIRGRSHDAFVYEPFTDDNESVSGTNLPYFQWGDEILQKSGEMNPALEYPTCAPVKEH